VRVRRSSDRRITYVAVVTALVAAFALAACGRKAGLDPPPSSSVPAVPQSNMQSQPSAFFTPSAAPAASQSSTAQDQTPPANAAPKKSFFLDWLLN